MQTPTSLKMIDLDERLDFENETLPLSVFLADVEKTQSLGAMIAPHLKKGDIIYLVGELGAGKSALARGLIRALTSADQDVPSPTFSLLQTYEAKHFDIAHLDLYRLNSPSEAFETGLFEIIDDGVTIIEWPDKLGHLGFDDYLEINLNYMTTALGFDARLATITPCGQFQLRKVKL